MEKPAVVLAALGRLTNKRFPKEKMEEEIVGKRL
jgi:hypothetical protein